MTNILKKYSEWALKTPDNFQLAFFIFMFTIIMLLIFFKWS
jgi:hypothetical protein